MPVRYPFLDLAQANSRYADALSEAARRVVRSGRYIGGQEVTALESEMTLACEVKYCVGVGNGLDALRLILQAYRSLGRLDEGDGVIVPANTYIASVLAVCHAGLTPVLVDPQELTMNLSESGISEAVKKNVRAVMPVHLYGRVAWSEDMLRIVRDMDLIVVEDAAQAIGAVSATPGMWGSSKAGGLGHAAAFSFYPTKNVGALGDGGAVTTNDYHLAAAVRALANYGSDRRYHNIFKGFNSRLDPIQAAMIRVKLADLEQISRRRRRRADIYLSEIDNPRLLLPLHDDGCVWHQFVVRVKDGARDRFVDWMRSNGVETDIHYEIPPHLQPCFYGLRHEPLPLTERLANEIVSLPIGDSASLSDIHDIAAIANAF